MRIAVVIHAHQPQSGGGYTFNQSVLASLRAFARSSQHSFVYYSVGGMLTEPPGCIEIPLGPRAQRRRAALQLLRDLQVRAGWHGRWSRTWFESSLDEQGVDLVWFVSSYLDDCDRPFVATVWDLAHLEQPWFPEVSHGGEWLRRQHVHTKHLPRAARVIVPNAAGKRQLVEHLAVPESRVMTLPHPTPSFVTDQAMLGEPVEQVLERFEVSRPYLLYPAQYWAHKNHYNLLRSVAELKSRGVEMNLVCVGSDQGEQPHVERSVAEMGLDEQVRLLDFVETPELVALYRGAHALVYLSFFGPENLPPLEAFALGCPVIYSDIPGAAEQLGDGALLVDPQDPAAVADAVRSLDDRTVRDGLVAAGRSRAAQLPADRYVEAVTAFFDEFEHVRRCWPSAALSS